MMRRLHIVPVILMLAVIVALRVQAQEHTHTVAMPESLTWVEPATLPGARLAVVQGDPGKEGLTPTSHGWAARRPSCRCRAWARPISGS